MDIYVPVSISIATYNLKVVGGGCLVKAVYVNYCQNMKCVTVFPLFFIDLRILGQIYVYTIVILNKKVPIGGC